MKHHLNKYVTRTLLNETNHYIVVGSTVDFGQNSAKKGRDWVPSIHTRGHTHGVRSFFYWENEM